MSDSPAIYGPDGEILSGVLRGVTPGQRQTFLVDNRTELPDEAVEYALETHFTETAEALGVGRGRLDAFSAQTYSGDGSLLSRAKFVPPSNVIEEISLARELAERDDDVAPAMDLIISAALSEGMQHNHPDEQTRVLFNRMAALIDMDHLFEEMLREWLIAGQVTTASIFGSELLTFTPEGGDGRSRRDFRTAVPRVGVIPAERIRTVGSDLFGQARLAYSPGDDEEQLKNWLDKFFAESGVSAAEKSAMKKEDPVSAQLFIERLQLSSDDQSLIGADEDVVYLLNPRLVHRSTRAKGSWQHPRPLLTRNFALIEAKRLLNLLDHALLQGGINFLVVAKKGSDKWRATRGEVEALNETVRNASRSGVIVGDHRLSIEIITPNMDSMLSTNRRQLLGRKLANAILRIPEATADEAANEAVKAELEFLPRIVTQDRRRIMRHVENKIYEEIINRNKGIFKYGSPSVWFPKVIMQGTQYFTDYQVKLYDRGLLSKDTMTAGGGFDYDSELQQRIREQERGDEDTMIPPPQPGRADGPDNGPGRPSGSSPDNGRPGARDGGPDPAAPANTRRGEPVTAFFDGPDIMRMGDNTRAILDQHVGEWEIGRISAEERELISNRKVGLTKRGIRIFPVNNGYEVHEEKAVRIQGGATVYTARRKRDKAIVATALGFRENDFTVEQAMLQAKRWGFDINELRLSEDD